MKKYFIILIATAILLLVAPALPTYASSVINDKDADIPATVIYGTDTVYSDSTPCQVNCKALIPDGFNLSCIVNLMRWDAEEDSNDYQVVLYSTNDYAGRIYLPEGTYKVWVQIAEDNTSKYPFLFPEEIEVKKDEVFLLEAQLENYEEIESDINTRLNDFNACSFCGEILDATGNCSNINCSTNNQQTITKKKNETTVTFSHTGNGTGEIYSTGKQTWEYDIIIEIIKSGQLNESVFKISLDSGQTYSEDLVIPLSGVLSLKNAGLDLNFSGYFQEGDSYHAWFKNPAKDISVKKEGNGAANIELLHVNEDSYAYDVMYINNYQFVLEIKKDGTLGESVFTYSLDNGKTFSEEMYVPQEGVYLIGDTGLKIIFDSTQNTPFMRGDSFSVIIDFPQEADLTSLYAIVIILLIVIIITFFFLISKRTKDSDYTLQKWYIPED